MLGLAKTVSKLRAELEAVRYHGARMVALAGDEAVGIWNQLEVLICQWRAIEALLGEPAPFAYRATRTTLRAVQMS